MTDTPPTKDWQYSTGFGMKYELGESKPADAQFHDPDVDPAPRPTCGTCPYWEAPTGSDAVLGREDAGECRVEPTINHRFRYHWCGQHPGMAAWIRDEWPKVKR